MDETIEAYLFLATVAALISIPNHILVKNYLRAIIISSLSALIVQQAYQYYEVGYLDPFFIIAMSITGAISVISSAIVGFPFLLFRKIKTKNPWKVLLKLRDG